jgi:hypothetical protein
MGYRINLNIIDKEYWESFINEPVHKVQDDDYYFWDTFDNSKYKTETEISDMTKINHFTKVKLTKDNEYPLYILTKVDFLEIIKFYQHFLAENSGKEIEKIEKIRDQYSKTKTFNAYDIMEVLSHSCWLEENIQYYFGTRLKKCHELVLDDSRFLLQYFYLVDLYNNFNEQTQVLIISHG